MNRTPFLVQTDVLEPWGKFAKNHVDAVNVPLSGRINVIRLDVDQITTRREMDQRQKENGMVKAEKKYLITFSISNFIFNFVTIFCSILILMFVIFFMINKH